MNLRPIVLCAAIVLMALPAKAEKLYGLLGDGDLTVAYSPCEAEEDAAECLVHIISCRPNETVGNGLELTIVGQGSDGEGPSQTLTTARAMLERPYGTAKMTASIGGKPVDLGLQQIAVTSNGLNGDWDVVLHSFDQSAFFDALTAESAAAVTIEAGGAKVLLADGPDDATKLIKFKAACEKAR